MSENKENIDSGNVTNRKQHGQYQTFIVHIFLDKTRANRSFKLYFGRQA
jgi:hypothetical protein